MINPKRSGLQNEVSGKPVFALKVKIENGKNPIPGQILTAAVATLTAVTAAVAMYIMFAAMSVTAVVAVTGWVAELVVALMARVMLPVAVVVPALVAVVTAAAATALAVTLLVAVYLPASLSLLAAVISVGAATALVLIAAVAAQFFRPLLGLQFFQTSRAPKLTALRLPVLGPTNWLEFWLRFNPHLSWNLWENSTLSEEAVPRREEFSDVADQHGAEPPIRRRTKSTNPHRLKSKPKSQE